MMLPFSVEWGEHPPRTGHGRYSASLAWDGRYRFPSLDRQDESDALGRS